MSRPTTAATDEDAIRANYAQLRSLVAAAEKCRDTDKLEEAAALASLTLFISMIAVWAQVLTAL